MDQAIYESSSASLFAVAARGRVICPRCSRVCNLMPVQVHLFEYVQMWVCPVDGPIEDEEFKTEDNHASQS